MVVEVAPKRHPMEEASIFSKLLYCWLLPLIWKGNKKDLTTEDIYDCPEKDRAESLKKKLKRNWQRELEKQGKGRRPNFLIAVLKTFGYDWLADIVYIVLKECVAQPILALCLGLVVEAWSSGPGTKHDLLVYTPVAFCFMVLFHQLVHHLAIFKTYRMGMDLRVACSALAYEKVLRLSQSSLDQTTTGQIVNLFSNDVSRFDLGMAMVPYIVIAPIQALLIAVVIYCRYGPAFLAGLLLIPLYLALQGVMARLFSKLRMKTALLTDDRIRLMSEVISGMRVIKMYAWEPTFAAMVDLARRNSCSWKNEMKRKYHIFSPSRRL